MRTTVLACLLLFLLAACGGGEEAQVQAPSEEKPASEMPPAGETPPMDETDSDPQPDRVTVDHILIGVRSAGHAQWRPAPEAKVLAYRLLKELEGGADWAELKREHSDDPPPGGPYTMANDGIQPQRGEFPRGRMAKAFGDVGFSLEVGEMGMADYDPSTSPFGYHIIKRIR